jgi:hypothetical protein
MSREPKLPDDLDRLGVYLEAAASVVRHIPDEPLPPSGKAGCRATHDCRAFVKPRPQTDPMGNR